MSILRLPTKTLTTITAQTSQTATNAFQTLYSAVLPYGYLNKAGRQIHVRCWGTWTADATPPATLTLTLKYGNTAVWETSARGVVGGPYTDRWIFDCDVVTVSNGNTRAYGMWCDYEGPDFISSALAVARTPTTSGAVTVAFGHTWASADAGSNFTIEMGSITPVGEI